MVKTGLTAGLVLGLALANVVPVNRVAASTSRPEGAGVSQDAAMAPTGIVTGSGTISVNGNSVQSGATIFTNSQIVTGSDGNATIDLGTLGRVEVRRNTKALLVFAPGKVDVQVDGCGEVTQFVPASILGRVTVNEKESTIQVASGQVNVKGDGGTAKVLSSGQSDGFDSQVVAVASGETNFTTSINRNSDGPAGGPILDHGLGAGSLTGFLLAIGGTVAGLEIVPSPDVDPEDVFGVSAFQP